MAILVNFILATSTTQAHYVLQSGEELNLDEVAQAVDLLRVFTSQLFTKINCLESQVNNLQSELKVLKDRQIQWEKLEANLLVGEIANAVEKEMVKYILKDCPNEDRSYLTLYQLEQILASVKRPGNHCETFQLLPDQIKTANENYGRLIHYHLKPKGNLKGMIQQFYKYALGFLSKLYLVNWINYHCLERLKLIPQNWLEFWAAFQIWMLNKLPLDGKPNTNCSEFWTVFQIWTLIDIVWCCCKICCKHAVDLNLINGFRCL